MFGLRLNGRIPVNLGRVSLQDPDLEPLGKAKHVDRAGNTRLRRLDWIPLIVNWRSRASKIINLVHFNKKRKGHIVAEKFEASIIKQALDIAARSSEEIVNTQDIVALTK